MGFRFYRRVKILPGITLNFSKSGISTSVGVRGARLTFGKHGTRATVGLPGTGMSYSAAYQKKKGSKKTVFSCPACKKLWYYDKRMDGEELICTCGHHFYLNQQPVQSKPAGIASSIGCAILMVALVVGIVFAFNSCKEKYDESVDQEKFSRSESVAKSIVELRLRQHVGGVHATSTRAFYKEVRYDENGRTWYLSGKYSNNDENKSGSFEARVYRPYKPKKRMRSDCVLEYIDIK